MTQGFQRVCGLPENSAWLPKAGLRGAIQLAQHGAHVAINYYRNAEAAQSVVETIEKAGGKALAFQADVAQQQEVERTVAGGNFII